MTDLELSNVVEKLYTTYNIEKLVDVCWSFAKITECRDDNIILKIIETGCHQKLIELLSMEDSLPLQEVVLQIICDLVTGNDYTTQKLLNENLLPRLSRLFRSPDKSIYLNLCFCISNVTAGNRVQIQMVLEEYSILQNLISILQYSNEEKVKIESFWAISNIITGGSFDQIDFIISVEGCLQSFCKTILEIDNTRLQSVGLDSIEKILSTNEIIENRPQINQIISLFKQTGLLNKLHEFQTSHTNGQVRQKSRKLILLFLNTSNK